MSNIRRTELSVKKKEKEKGRKKKEKGKRKKEKGKRKKEKGKRSLASQTDETQLLKQFESEEYANSE